MKGIKCEMVRNFTLCGQSGSGKTSLADVMLYKCGANSRQGSVDQGTSMSDYRDEERERMHSLYSTPLHCEWGNNRFVFIDAPGYLDFEGDMQASISVADTALIVVDAEVGLDVGSIRAWQAAEQRGVPRAFFINGCDKENASFSQALSTIQKQYGSTVCVPFTVPVGEKSELSSVVNVLHDEEIPDSLAESVSEYNEALMDTIAESDEELMNKYLEGEKLTSEEISKGLHAAILSGDVVPVFAGSVGQDVGVDELMNGIVTVFPDPLNSADIPMQEGESSRDLSDDALGFVFKTNNDPYLGRVSFVRIYAGSMQGDHEVHNVTQNVRERVGTLQILNGKQEDATEEVHPGDIVALAKLKNTGVNDTLCSKAGGRQVEPMTFPQPTLMYAVVPEKEGEEEKIGDGLGRLCEEDPTVTFERNTETKENILTGMGDQQIHNLVHRLKEQFKVEIQLKKPKVPYRETITAKGDASHRHKKQSGGRGQFAEVYMRVEPLQQEEYEFVNEVVGGHIPKNFIPAVEKGVIEAMQEGPLAGCRVINVRAVVYDGKYHPVDSSDLAFQIAGRSSFQDAMQQAKPQLLEPVMKLNIVFPEEYMGDVNADLNSRRGRIHGMDTEGGMQYVTAEAPLAEVFDYTTQLRSMTQGRGTFTMEFDTYEPVPSHVAQDIQEGLKKEAGAES